MYFAENINDVVARRFVFCREKVGARGMFSSHAPNFSRVQKSKL